MPFPALSSNPHRFGAAQDRQLQVRFHYDEQNRPIRTVTQDVSARIPSRATSIVWIGSSFRVGRLFFRRTLRNYLIPAAQFLMQRRII